MYSLTWTARLNGINLQHYLTGVLGRVADHPARQIAEPLRETGDRSKSNALLLDPPASPGSCPGVVSGVPAGHLETATNKSG